MKAKYIGLPFLIAGLLFAILGTVMYVRSLQRQDERIYTTARIVSIEKERDRHSDSSSYNTYVELERNGTTEVVRLNVYRFGFEVGKELQVYYFPGETGMVYEKGSGIFNLAFTAFGGLCVAVGITLILRKDQYIPVEWEYS